MAAPSSASTSRSAPTAASPSTQADLAELKRVKDAHGGTVNDVILSIVAGALGNYLRARGHDTEGLELRAMVPVSVRADEEHGALGNRISAMMAPLPVWCEDPVERLHVVTEEMGDLKGSGQAVGAEILTKTHRLRAADDRLPGGPPAAGAALLQPRRHQRAGTAVPALRARPQDGVDLPDGAAGPPPGALRRDHVLRRPGQLRPDRRLRRDGRPRQLRARPRGGDRGDRRHRAGQGEAAKARSKAASSNGTGTLAAESHAR